MNKSTISTYIPEILLCLCVIILASTGFYLVTNDPYPQYSHLPSVISYEGDVGHYRDLCRDNIENITYYLMIIDHRLNTENFTDMPFLFNRTQQNLTMLMDNQNRFTWNFLEINRLAGSHHALEYLNHWETLNNRFNTYNELYFFLIGD